MKSARFYMALILASSALTLFIVTRPRRATEPVAGSVMVVRALTLAEAVENLRNYVRDRPDSVLREKDVALDIPALRAALRDSEGFRRIKAARALGRDDRFVEEAFPVALEELNHQGLECLAAEAIWSMGKAAIPSILDRIGDPDPNIRGKVLFLLGGFEELNLDLATRIIPILVAASSDKNADVRRTCNIALSVAGLEPKHL